MSKIDLTRLEEIQSPKGLDDQVLEKAKKRIISINKAPFSSIKSKMAISYCVGLFSMFLVDFINYPSLNDLSQRQISADEINLSSLKINTRGNSILESLLNLDSMPISKLKEIHHMLIQIDQWEEANKLGNYIQQRQGRINAD